MSTDGDETERGDLSITSFSSSSSSSATTSPLLSRIGKSSRSSTWPRSLVREAWSGLEEKEETGDDGRGEDEGGSGAGGERGEEAGEARVEAGDAREEAGEKREVRGEDARLDDEKEDDCKPALQLALSACTRASFADVPPLPPPLTSVFKPWKLPTGVGGIFEMSSASPPGSTSGHE